MKPWNRGWNSRTTDTPGSSGCWPTVLPTGPEKLPVCTPDTRSGPSCSAGIHNPCAGGIDRRRQESRTSYAAAVAVRELHAGR